MQHIEKKFNLRAFITLIIAFSGIGLPITGIANHIYQFYPLTVAWHAWMSAHSILGLLFVVFSCWHILLNRRTLVNYIKGKVLSVSREAIYAAIVVTLALFLFVGHAFH